MKKNYLIIICLSLWNTVVVHATVLRITSIEILRNRQVGVNCCPKNDLIIHATGGSGNLQYQLNKGPFQLQNHFEDVSAGNHRLVIKDTSTQISVPALITISDHLSIEWFFKDDKYYSVITTSDLVISKIEIIHPDCEEQNNGIIQMHTISKNSTVTYKLFKQGSSMSQIQENNGVFSHLSPGQYYLVANTETANEQVAGIVLVNNAPPTLQSNIPVQQEGWFFNIPFFSWLKTFII